MIILRPAKKLILLWCWANQRLLGWRLDVFLAGFNYYHGQIINTALHLSRTAGRLAHVVVGACLWSKRWPMVFWRIYFCGGARYIAPQPRTTLCACKKRSPSKQLISQTCQIMGAVRVCVVVNTGLIIGNLIGSIVAAVRDHAANKVNISLCPWSINQFFYWWSKWIGLKTIIF